MSTSNQESISQTLLWCLLSVLSVGILTQLLLFILIIKHKESPSIKASQPVGMSLITIGGCFTFIGGICLIVPSSVPTCAISEAIIFISITIIGSSLAAMAWRVERIASPIAMFGRRRRNSSDNITQRGVNVGFIDGHMEDTSLLYKIKKRNVEILTSIAELSFRKQIAISNRSIHGSPIRQTITKRSLIKVTGFLLLPQVIFQVLDMALVQLRRYPLDDGGICVRPSNTWWTVLVGTILTVLPFLSLLITVYKREEDTHIPDVLSLEDSTRCILICFSVAALSIAPILGFDTNNPNVSIYISIYLLLVAVGPITWFVIWIKLRNVILPKKGSAVDIGEQIRTSVNRSMNDKRHEKAVEALEQGRIFDELNMPKSIKIYNDALDMWQQSSEQREFVGDFTSDEIKSFNGRDCELIAKLLIAKAVYSEAHYVLKAAECYLKAIEIFEFAPSQQQLKDRTIIYPCFHALFRLLRDGKGLEQDFVFEKALAARFVDESKGTQDYHHACALALHSEMKARSGLFNEAIEEVDTMKIIYHLKDDSRAVKRVSGDVDVCALAISRAILWYMECDDEDAALEQVEVVINMLEDLESDNSIELHALLTPIIRILSRNKDDGRRSSQRRNSLDRQSSMISTGRGDVAQKRLLMLYENHVCTAAMPSYIRNMHLVLKLNDPSSEYKGTDDDFHWVLSDENKLVTSQLDSFFISMGMSLNTIAAEACACLAARSTKRDCSNLRAVIDKGLALATVANTIMKTGVNLSEGTYVICPMARTKNDVVLSELQMLADENGLHISAGQAMRRLNSTEIFDSAKSRRRKAALQLRAKRTLPHELLLQHDTVAFIGLTHDNLAEVFKKAIAEQNNKWWRSIFICYMSDSLLGTYVSSSDEEETRAEIEDLRQKITVSRKALQDLLEERVGELCFYEIKSHCFFGSFFGWREEGGYIHISPSIWGVDIKMSPSQSYRWEIKDDSPDPEYSAYSHGIENILDAASPFSTILEDDFNLDNLVVQASRRTLTVE